jgi:hypothetical protein
MQDPTDYELQKEPGDTQPPVSRPPSPLPWIIGAAVLAIAVTGYFFLGRDAAAPDSREETTATDTTIPPARPLGVEVDPIELPPLDQSDAFVSDLVRTLSSHPRVAAWLTTNGLIRNFTVVVENIAAGRTPSRHLRVLKPAEPFTVIEARGGDVVMDTRSYNRYNDIAAAVASVDAGGAAKLYSTLKPRIEEAYQDLGHVGSFDTALETAIVTLLEAPALEGDIALTPRGGVYAYNDARIERLTEAQKQLVRMGPRNVRIIQRKLREIALALGVAPERLPGR